MCFCLNVVFAFVLCSDTNVETGAHPHHAKLQALCDVFVTLHYNTRPLHLRIFDVLQRILLNNITKKHFLYESFYVD